MGIFSDALDMLAGRWTAVILACLLPLIGSALIEVIPVGDGWFVLVPLLLVQLCLYTCIAVAVHRVVLIGSDSVPRFGVMLHFSRRELRFAGFLLLFGCLVFAGFFLMNLGAYVSLLMLGALLYLVPVFSIVFPAAAVDNDLTLRELLSVGRYHYWLLAKATLVIPLIVGLLMKGLGEAAAEMFGDVRTLLAIVSAQAVGALVLIIEIAVLSVAYREIEHRESPQAVFGS